MPTAWVPISGTGGKIVSAKVEEKAAEGFWGHIFLPTGPLPHVLPLFELGHRWDVCKNGGRASVTAGLLGYIGFLRKGCRRNAGTANIC